MFHFLSAFFLCANLCVNLCKYVQICVQKVRANLKAFVCKFCPPLIRAAGSVFPVPKQSRDTNKRQQSNI